MDVTSAPDKQRLACILYNEAEAPEGKRVYTKDVQEWLDKAGWFDTPAKFGKKEVKPGPVKVIEKIKEGEPPKERSHDFLDNASELSDYINEEYSLKTNCRMGVKKLRKILKGEMDDNSIKDN